MESKGWSGSDNVIDSIPKRTATIGRGVGVSYLIVLAMGEEDLCSHVLLRFLTAFLLVAMSRCAASDVEALLAMKELLNGDALADWNGSNPCNWTGIQCGGRSPGRVVTLYLPDRNLTGTLDSMIGNLSSLQALNLSGNFISGPIPAEMRNCQGLKSVDLSGNSFEGKFTGLFELKNLTVLNLAENMLSGVIPLTVGTLERLQGLILRGNRALYGNIPDEIGNCTSLQRLDLSVSGFSGAIPPSLFLLKQLQVLNLRHNMLSGTLQHVESMALGLKRLTLSGNCFSGQLPGFFGNLTKLRVLKLARNTFTGSIPLSLWGLTNLEVLDLSANNLSGGLPAIIGKLSALRELAMYHNALEGPIPRELFDCRNLTSLILHNNQFSSQIPRDISNLIFLTNFELNDNLLTGSIPVEISNCSLLLEINVRNNRISGSLPAELARISNLTRFCVANNQLTGILPSEFFSMLSLEYIVLSHNFFTGSIPDNFTTSGHLLNLEVADNQLTGPIPFSLAKLRSLQTLDASRNQLSGELGGFTPYDDHVAGLQLQHLLLYDNHFSGTFLPNWTCMNNLLTLDLHGNNFGGSIPMLGQGLFQVQYIDLSRNRLQGEIPPDILYYDYLTTLNLSFNNLSGDIPAVIATSLMLNNGVIADFSSNNLSGSIPTSLNLPNLTLNVSNNNLSGSIPILLQRLGRRAFSGNPGLCGPPVANECPQAVERKEKKRAPVKFIVIGVLLGCWTISILAVAICFRKRGFRKRLKSWCGLCCGCRTGVQVEGIGASRSSATVVATWFGETCSNEEASSKPPPISPSLSDLSQATGGFSSSHIIGDGGFGKVYKGVLRDGTAVAVKKLTEDGYQGEREFDAELETLGYIRHQNLVRLFGFFSNNLERLLVYEYMPNNSLDTWLHGRTEGMAPLPWPVRIVIAKDVARGLTFLHHFCIPKVIHRDLKASNILLDANFNARLGDFGLARHLNTYDSHISTSVAGSLGYIAPEYAQSWRVTTRGDVFSFGVVLLELFSGKRPACGSYKLKHGGNLVGWVQYLFHSKKIIELFFDDAIDPMRGSDMEKEIMAILDIAIRCINEDPGKRPVMLEVLRTLEGGM